MTDVERLQEIIDSSKKIVFFGGAGVSTESGIPDFRSVDGLYNQKWDWPPEQILSHTFFLTHTSEFYRFYREKILIQGVEPNTAHYKLAEFEKAGKLLSVVTQNIDGLHQKAGSKRVWELHGSVLRNTCMNCGRHYDESVVLSQEGIPLCPECGGIIKPDVVLYEEPLDEDVMYGAIRDLNSADCLIIAGTSMTVYPAAGLVRYFGGDKIVLINRDATQADRYADLVIHDKVGKVLGQIRV